MTTPAKNVVTPVAKGPELRVSSAVHYVSYGTPGGEYPSVCRAAIVTAVGRKKKGVAQASLFVMNPEGIFLNQNVPYSDPGFTIDNALAGGTWHHLDDC